MAGRGRKATTAAGPPETEMKPSGGRMASEALQKSMAFLNKVYKSKDPAKWGLVALNPDDLLSSLPHLSTGSLVVDFLIGGKPNQHGVAPCPGIPRARFTQLWGHESAGKTTLALTLAASVCASGGTVCYIDLENEIMPDYALKLGVPIHDPSKFMLIQPETLEDAHKIMLVMASHGVDLIVVDSVGAGILAYQAERGVNEQDDPARPGALAKAWGEFLPKLKRTITKSQTAILAISQVRDAINSQSRAPGGKKTVQGGNAWKFFCSVRMELTRIKAEKGKVHNSLTHKVEDQVYGGVILIKMVKNKVSDSQGREAQFYIRHGEGIDDIRSMIDIASGHNIIKKSGSWYAWTPPGHEEISVQGSEGLRKLLLENKALADTLYQQVLPVLTKPLEGELDVGNEEFEDPTAADLERLLEAETGDED